MGPAPSVQAGRERCCRLERHRGRHRLEVWGRWVLGRGVPGTCQYWWASGGGRDPSWHHCCPGGRGHRLAELRVPTAASAPCLPREPRWGRVWGGRAVGRRDPPWGVPSTAQPRGKARGRRERSSFPARCPPREPSPRIGAGGGFAPLSSSGETKVKYNIACFGISSGIFSPAEFTGKANPAQLRRWMSSPAMGASSSASLRPLCCG